MPVSFEVSVLLPAITGAGYKLVTRDDFDKATDVPEGLRARLRSIRRHKFVVYDPHDDDQGWLLTGDDQDTLIRETHIYRVAEDEE